MDPLYPILEFDYCRDALIQPQKKACAAEIPERAVVCFFSEVITKLATEGRAKLIHHLRSEMGQNPVLRFQSMSSIYEFEVCEKRMALFHPGVGAPLAAAFLEEMIAHGCRKFIACGGCGVLDGSIPAGYAIVPVKAVRDEGTSYHYLPPAREIAASERAVAAIEQTLEAHGCQYITSKTWTTDGFYRETRDKINRRLSEGCLTVEMEAAALFAVAHFRGVEFGQLLFAGDDVSGNAYDARDYHGHGHIPGREKLFWLAAEACAAL